jgi:ABC-type transport system involved in multi-copper enzyme maturation permease subunit
MIWLTWRQFRAQAVTAIAALAAFAVLLAVTGPHLTSSYAASGISGCRGGGCVGLANSFLSQLDADRTYSVLYLLSIVIILVAPAVIGIFWGAPLVAREFEAGTHHLAWSQSITRTRWLAVKLTLTGLAAMAVTEALSLVQAWWAAPIGLAVGRGGSAGPGSLISMGQFSPLVFASHGVTPLAYAAFAFALGVTAGVHVRHAVLAMAVTLAVFAVFQVALPLWIRPHLFPPDQAITTLSSVSDIRFQESTRPSGSGRSQGTFTFSAGGLSSQPGAWVLSSGAVDAAANPVSTVPAACMQAATGDSGLDCLASHGIRVAVTYQPASRYWTFEWTEAAIYLVLALALAGYCFWLLSRRLT